MEPIELPDGVAQFDLHLILSDNHDEYGAAAGVDAAFTFAEDLFDRSTVEQFAELFVALLDRLAAAPDRPVGDVPLLAPGIAAEVLEGRNNTTVVLAPTTLADILASAFVAYPHASRSTPTGPSRTTPTGPSRTTPTTAHPVGRWTTRLSGPG